MKFDVDFTELHLSAAKMRGLVALARELSERQFTYSKAVSILENYVEKNSGTKELLTNETIKFKVFDEVIYVKTADNLLSYKID